MTAWQGHILDCLVPEERARAWRGVDSIIARGNGTGCDSPDPATRARLRRAGAEGRRISAIAVARYWRDARLTRIFEGNSEIQRRIIADGLLASAPLA